MPARSSQLTQVGRRRIELGNLEKVLFPDDAITKAHLIEYYFRIAPTLLAQVKGRPLTLVRFPDGIAGESFFQKNRPEHAPDWVERVRAGEDAKDYITATEEASLVWLANAACIEIHQMHVRAPHATCPDYIVYDFDPPPGYAFSRVAALAIAFKEHVESFGYHAFVKTTGRKGLHVLTPIEPRWSVPEVFEAAKAVAQPFVEAHPSALTLHLRKDARSGKVLLDIYRNRGSQTIVSPYSVRGVPGAPVSTPVTWEELARLEHAAAFTLHSIPGRVTGSGDPWEAFGAYATALHTAVPARRVHRGRTESPPALLAGEVASPPSDAARPKHKAPAQLASYAAKRTFGRTPEPPPDRSHGTGQAFVVHRHHASRLHYDLRLEQDGVLKSWAVPKGLPPRPGIRRLAVQVEDHPLAYVDFEGTIPRGEYGGGHMWRFAQGRYEVTRRKKDGFYFQLHSRELSAEYRMHRTDGNQWLLERVDTPQTDWLHSTVEPMLAHGATEPPDSDNYLFEVKWDGLRALIAIDEGTLSIRGRQGTDMTMQFPELAIPDQAFRATSALFDAEIVCLDEEGRPVFQDVVHRMQQKTPGAIARARQRCPAVCYVFDCLYLDGRSIMHEPLDRRRAWLADALKEQPTFRLSASMDDGPGLFQAVRDKGLEGIMAKLRASPYRPGQRSEAWLKIKVRQTAECMIVGYTRGRGERAGTLGALHLAQSRDGRLHYVGKVGTGFDNESLRSLAGLFRRLKPGKRPVPGRVPDEARTIWLEPKAFCEVGYASRTREGALREPVFLRLRPDLSL